MSEFRKDAPRRYIVDGGGQRVLVGLTISETIEFETLDRADIRLGGALRGKEQPGGQEKYDERWLELYVKHERAWSKWIAETRAGREKPGLLN